MFPCNKSRWTTTTLHSSIASMTRKPPSSLTDAQVLTHGFYFEVHHSHVVTLQSVHYTPLTDTVLRHQVRQSSFMSRRTSPAVQPALQTKCRGPWHQGRRQDFEHRRGIYKMFWRLQKSPNENVFANRLADQVL
jgi:hypothetical protein